MVYSLIFGHQVQIMYDLSVTELQHEKPFHADLTFIRYDLTKSFIALSQDMFTVLRCGWPMTFINTH